MSIKDLLDEAKQAIEAATKEIKASPTPLPKRTVNAILKLQRQVVALRDTAIILHREQGHSLADVAVAFELSGSRVSQIANGKHPPQTRRIRTRRPLRIGTP